MFIICSTDLYQEKVENDSSGDLQIAIGPAFRGIFEWKDVLHLFPVHVESGPSIQYPWTDDDHYLVRRSLILRE